MKKLFCTCFLFCLFFIIARAELTLNYDLRFEPENHYINVTLHVSDAPMGVTLLKMPVWAPGYYQILDSPKHLTQFAAAADDGTELLWEKVGKSGWKIENGTCRDFIVSYRLFAHKQSVAEAYVDAEKAFLPGNEVYLYADGRKDAASTVTLHLPESWNEACSGLKVVEKKNGEKSFFAKDFDTLVDSPIFAGNPTVRNFSHEGRYYTICIAEARDLDLDQQEREMRAIISAATKTMGAVPYDNYCFLWLWQGGGGLEHLNSQADFVNSGLYNSDKKEHRSWLNFVTHEYFHLYNVKSIRPYELGPFNYDGECYTDQLWISEGLTCYYEHLLMRRAGLSSSAEMIEDWMEYVRDIEQNEGRKHMSLATSSYDIWLNFFSHDPSTDRISYYVKGPIVGLFLDLAIRQATSNRHSLDELMRLLYQRFFVEKARGFHPEEFWAAVEEVTEGNPLNDIRQLVYTTQEIDYDHFLSYAGFSLNRDLWTLVPMKKPSKLQQAIRHDVFGE